MTIDALVPVPTNSDTFEPRSVRFVPEYAGCYVLATFSQVVLYIGRTINLQTRIKQHLADEDKVKMTPQGRATLFFWFECSDIERIERTWTNLYIQCEGRLPPMNSVYPSVST